MKGKGRIVDYLAQRAEMVIRFQGGDNAGHTVVNEHGTFRLHLVPSGIFNPATRCIIGAGTVVNPDTLLEEMAELTRAGISLDNLWLSERAQVVMPYHRLLDGLEESARGGQQIGTTKRGIGPAYADKAARTGIRLGDLTRPDYLAGRLAQALPQKNLTLQHFGQPPLALDDLVAQADGVGRDARPAHRGHAADGARCGAQRPEGPARGPARRDARSRLGHLSLRHLLEPDCGRRQAPGPGCRHRSSPMWSAW